MQRVLKFRGWSEDNKTMLVPQDLSQAYGWWGWLGQRDAILMQFTGLKDKNGVDIYEGDIVKTEYDFDSGSFDDPCGEFGVWMGKVLISPYHGAHVRRALVWDQAAMHSDLSKEPKPNVRNSTWRVKANKCVVIGNIHEDMQLLHVPNEGGE